MAVIHVTEADATRDFGALLKKVRSGAEIEIRNQDETIAVLRAPLPRRTASEVLRRAKERGSTLLLDSEFGNDVEAGIRSHEHERLIDPWESF